MGAVFNSKKESLPTEGSYEREAVGISRLRGSFFEAINVVFDPKTKIPNQTGCENNVSQPVLYQIFVIQFISSGSLPHCMPVMVS